MSNKGRFSMDQKIQIDVPLVKQLICSQFPQWKKLCIKAVASSGWDNRTFHLGDDMLVRLPSSTEYASQVKKEHWWLPQLAPHLPLEIPKPIAMGKPTAEYLLPWSVYSWIEGQTATIDNIADRNQFASQLAEFLKALWQCDTMGGPLAGPSNFYRGGPLATYDIDTKKAIGLLEDKKQALILTTMWEKALGSIWQNPPVWVHGDIAIGNLLIKDKKLSAVIDFGQLGVGDPACDLVIYWTFLSGKSQELFRQILGLDSDTWNRGRGWALWKTLCAPIAGTDCKKILNEIMTDFEREGE